jgi:hypothetical protein
MAVVRKREETETQGVTGEEWCLCCLFGPGHLAPRLEAAL